MQDTRSKYKQAGKPLSIGLKRGTTPGVYSSGTQGNQRGTNAQSPTSGLTMVQSSQPSPGAGVVGSSANPTPQINARPPLNPQALSNNRGGSGGTISTGSGLTRVVAPSAPKLPGTAGYMNPMTSPVSALKTPAMPVAAPTTVNAQQTESANPLTGAGNQQPGSTTTTVNPGAAMGFSRRGSMTPQGMDATPIPEKNNLQSNIGVTAANLGGNSLFNKRFSRPDKQQIAAHSVRQLFGDSANPEEEDLGY